MGMSVNRGGGQRRRHSHRPMGEINVTPFVDVMLVLLIVFMVTAPLLTVGVPVDLPKTQAGQINADQAPLVVSLQKQGKIFLQDTEIDADNLVPRLRPYQRQIIRFVSLSEAIGQWPMAKCLP